MVCQSARRSLRARRHETTRGYPASRGVAPALAVAIGEIARTCGALSDRRTTPAGRRQLAARDQCAAGERPPRPTAGVRSPGPGQPQRSRCRAAPWRSANGGCRRGGRDLASVDPRRRPAHHHGVRRQRRRRVPRRSSRRAPRVRALRRARGRRAWDALQQLAAEDAWYVDWRRGNRRRHGRSPAGRPARAVAAGDVVVGLPGLGVGRRASSGRTRRRNSRSGSSGRPGSRR